MLMMVIRGAIFDDFDHLGMSPRLGKPETVVAKRAPAVSRVETSIFGAYGGEEGEEREERREGAEGG